MTGPATMSLRLTGRACVTICATIGADFVQARHDSMRGAAGRHRAGDMGGAS